MSSFFLHCCLLVPMPPGPADSATSCPQNVNISGGTFTLSHGWAPGSLLIYSCPQGLYPSPASRLCKSSGQWQTPRATRSLTKAVCKREAPCGLCSGCYTRGHPRTFVSELLRVGLNLTRWQSCFCRGLFKISRKCQLLVARNWEQVLMETVGC